MILAQVVGTVVSTQKEPSMVGLPLVILQQVDPVAGPMEGAVVAVDALGVGDGDMVLFAAGSTARQTSMTRDRPCDAVVMAIVDKWTIGDADFHPPLWRANATLPA